MSFAGVASEEEPPPDMPKIARPAPMADNVPPAIRPVVAKENDLSVHLSGLLRRYVGLSQALVFNVIPWAGTAKTAPHKITDKNLLHFCIFQIPPWAPRPHV